MKMDKRFKFKKKIKEKKITMRDQSKTMRLIINKMKIRKKMMEMKMMMIIMLQLKFLKLKSQTKTLSVENLSRRKEANKKIIPRKSMNQNKTI